MDCTELSKVFAGERAEDLSAEESAAFEEHLAACSRCLEALASAEDALAPLTDWEPPAPSEADWERVRCGLWEEIDLRERATRRGGRGALPLFLAAAALLLFSVGLALVLSSASRPAPRSGATATVSGQAASDPSLGAVELLEVEAGPGYRQHVEPWPVVCIAISERP
ncbi:MAG: hypothetical protein D6731_05715 [Planctomycetota bacterium]|nr:MAG: hypothetical protein D6731_05715 [Planctomycetota bacterium]